MKETFKNILPLLKNNKSRNGHDFLYLNSSNDILKSKSRDRQKKATDFSIINAQNAVAKNGKYFGWYRLSDSKENGLKFTYAISPDGNLEIFGNDAIYCGFAPCVNIRIPKNYSIKNYENNFSKVNSFLSKIKREKPVIKLGAYPQTYVNKELSNYLEKCFNNGNLKDGMVATGRYYTCNGNLIHDNGFFEKRCPEFEIDGKRYVRYHQKKGVINVNGRIYRDENMGWFKVEPVEFIVKNWSKMPTYINPKGTNEDIEFNLETKNIMFSGISFGNNSYEDSFVKKFMNETLLNEIFNPERFAINVLTIPKYVKMIASNAYEGCVSLDKVVIHKDVNYIGENAFKYCNFRYFLQDKKTDEVLLQKEKPTDFSNYNYIIDLSKLKKCIQGSDYDVILNCFTDKEYDKLNDYKTLIEKLSKADLSVPFTFIKRLEQSNILNKFLANDFRFLKNEIPNISEILNSYPEDHRVSFYDFATAFGCFEHSPILDKNGKPTNYLIAQKACSVLAQLLKSKQLDIENIHYLLSASKGLMTYNSRVNQDFINFLSIKGKQNNFENLEMLLSLEDEYRGCFANAMCRFSNAMNMRNQPDAESGIKKLPWKEVFIRLQSQYDFENVTYESWPIAKLFSELKIEDQCMFDTAKHIYEKAKNAGINSHILQVPLKEKSVQESIEEIKNETENQLKVSRDVIDDLYAKSFTYEFLDKLDPKNVIIGTYCSCCAIIGTNLYGSKIAESTVVAPDVQNLVVRDARNNIVAKAAMYVNKSKGYIVFNDFEINEKYRKNEKGAGIYNDYSLSETGIARDEIFNAFMRGLHDFIKEYDKENPEKPIRIATVGNGYNRLKQQCARFKIATNNLKVPFEYNFADAMDQQNILYENKNEIITDDFVLESKESTKGGI